MPTSRNRKKNKVVSQPVERIHTPAFLEAQSIKKKVDSYRAMMLKVNDRMNKVQSVISKAIEGVQEFELETVALNFRKILELIIYANLEGNREDYYSIHAPERRDWNIKLLIDRIKSINPHYFPVPMTVDVLKAAQENKLTFTKYTGLAMTEDDMVDLFNICGKLLHEDKVDILPPDAREYLPIFTDWYYKLAGLLKSHFVYLTNTQRIIATLFLDTQIRVVLLESVDIQTPFKL
jgi:hypothetical protein